LKAEVATFLRFCVVGAIGFVIDSGTTLLLLKGLHFSPVVARVVAFLVAASATWALNKQYTFRASGLASWLPYVLLTTAGALLNVGVYLAWISWTGTGAMQVLLGIALGSACALCLNYTVSRQLIFTHKIRQ
jgi:putative flippase GtrA